MSKITNVTNDTTKQIKEVIGLIDRSGSMTGKEADTIGGINTMLKELKENVDNKDFDIRVSVKYFNHKEELIWRSIPLDMITLLDVSTYIPDGNTALLDTLGKTLKHFMSKYAVNYHAYHSCIIYVATDGIDNSSYYYSKSNIKEMIKRAKEHYNIEVIYLGANQNAIEEAGAIGIPASQAINYSETAASTQSVYKAVARMASSNEKTLTPESGFTPVERINSARRE